MRQVRAKNTKPEMLVRRLVHSMGYRYRLHVVDLPGKPDLVFRSKKKVIFVHGCFWHGHKGCRNHRIPKTRVMYWTKKIEGNYERDKKVRRRLRRMGFDCLVLWECELQDKKRVAQKIQRFLGQ